MEYSLSKGKGNKVSAEKVNKTHAGKAVPGVFCLQGSWHVLRKKFVNDPFTIGAESKKMLSVGWALLS